MHSPQQCPKDLLNRQFDLKLYYSTIFSCCTVPTLLYEHRTRGPNQCKAYNWGLYFDYEIKGKKINHGESLNM